MTQNLTKCTAKDRRNKIAGSKINGIDYIEVIKLTSPNSPYTDRLYLIVYFFNPLTNSDDPNDRINLDAHNVRIEGGVKIKNIRIKWAIPYAEYLAADDVKSLFRFLNDEQIKDINSLNDPNYIDLESKDKLLIVCPSSDGDFSTYTLRIVDSLGSNSPPEDFDLLLSSIDFSFKIDSLSKFDCKLASVSSQEVPQEPLIDYLSKDYASFRHLALSRLALLIPDWKERNVADMGIMMAELLAYMGDYLSYYQDAVATEAYLGTARSRISVKRHARLLDYYMHSGCNARVWISIQTKAYYKPPTDACEISAEIPVNTKFLTGRGNGDKDWVVAPEDLEKELSQGAKVFEAMYPLKLYSSHNTIAFYTWGNSDYCLPKGSTQATLCGKLCTCDDVNSCSCKPPTLKLKPGDVLIFEETHSCEGVAEDYDISHRHVVRLTKVNAETDNLTKISVVSIAWALEDALPFPLCLSKNSSPVAVAHGNVLLADHGNSLKAEKLVDPDVRLNFRPHLKHGPLTFRGPFDASASASSAFNYNLDDVTAAITLRQLNNAPPNEFANLDTLGWVPGEWMPQQDLFSSNKFKTHFVVETENDGTAIIRFGDGVHGLNPQTVAGEAPELLYGFYRVGNGVDGNVGAESIRRIVASENTFDEGVISDIRNPIAARGGLNPESMVMVRQNAPEAVKINERAITDADYADIVMQKCPEVQSAVAKTRWTGSWYTIYVMVDRFGRRAVDEAFKTKIQKVLDRYRLSGYDIEVCGPQYVPIELEIKVTVSSDSLCEEVEKNLLDVFSTRTLPNGVRGFFHPDNFTFGQPLLIRDLYSALAKVEGVIFSLVTSLTRADKVDDSALECGLVELSPYEIIQLDNDANYPENGHITFTMKGGR